MLRWTSSAERDLARLHDFLRPLNPQAATQAARHLVAAAEHLLTYPQLGMKLDEFAPREVRRIIIGDYELRYEIAANAIHVLRVWHGREERL